MTTIPADKWDEFMAWLDADPTPEEIEKLRRLLAAPTPWEREEVMLEPDQTGKNQAVIVRTHGQTVVVIGHDLIVERHDDDSFDFGTGLRKGLEAAGIEVLP